MKVLVTGCNGFIGKKLTKALISSGFHVLGIDLTSQDAELSTSPLFSFISLNLDGDPLPDLLGFDCVVHLAISMNPKRSQSSDELLNGTYRLLQAMESAKVPILVGMSSMSVLDFEYVQENSTINEETPRCTNYEIMGRYAALKSAQEAVFINYSNHAWATVAIVRPGLVYEGERLSDAYAGIIKNKLSIIISNNGFVPLVEINSLIEGISNVIQLGRNQKKVSFIHFVDDYLPTQSDYLKYLRQRGAISTKTISVNWRVFKILINIIFTASRQFNLHHSLPDLLMPQAFSTRLKPFKYSNAYAKELLGWKPNCLIKKDL
ncbi:NAD(P)-dependent oxidoreductase [Methylophilus sp. Leaf408]|uniref:NAD-dependent epimerase/dehydratase family protein n=1 Tax=Methylophilus sp. Leaf408 TaxID=2876561 RepID=UPI001E2942D9|nr:NAD(P)-dependent oxidoreductase [Methylophilus sp. Leaf408]